MEEENTCIGCNLTLYCEIRDYYNADGLCPCALCLVKTMCIYDCPPRTIYVKNLRDKLNSIAIQRDNYERRSM